MLAKGPRPLATGPRPCSQRWLEGRGRWLEGRGRIANGRGPLANGHGPLANGPLSNNFPMVCFHAFMFCKGWGHICFVSSLIFVLTHVYLFVPP